MSIYCNDTRPCETLQSFTELDHVSSVNHERQHSIQRNSKHTSAISAALGSRRRTPRLRLAHRLLRCPLPLRHLCVCAGVHTLSGCVSEKQALGCQTGDLSRCVDKRWTFSPKTARFAFCSSPPPLLAGARSSASSIDYSRASTDVSNTGEQLSSHTHC